MLKLESLRSLMSSVVPELARDPERLIIMARAGRCKSSGTASLSFEYAYTAQVYVLDWAGAADAIIVPILAWLREQQIEQFDNPARWPEQLLAEWDFDPRPQIRP